MNGQTLCKIFCIYIAVNFYLFLFFHVQELADAADLLGIPTWCFYRKGKKVSACNSIVGHYFLLLRFFPTKP